MSEFRSTVPHMTMAQQKAMRRPTTLTAGARPRPATAVPASPQPTQITAMRWRGAPSRPATTEAIMPLAPDEAATSQNTDALPSARS
jgi:hypothetical protein